MPVYLPESVYVSMLVLVPVLALVLVLALVFLVLDSDLLQFFWFSLKEDLTWRNSWRQSEGVMH